MFIVLEKFNVPTVVTDEEGNVKYFDYFDDAQREADNCQDGQVIEL